MATSAHDPKQGRDEPAAELERTAAEWFFRRDAGHTREEENAFQSWLGADPRHARAWAEIDQTWHSLGEAEPQVVRATRATEGRHEIQFETTDRFAARRSAFRAWLPVLAAAAVLVIAALGWRVVSSGAEARERGASFAEQAATEIGGMRKLDLPDGSFVTLNTNSAVDIQFAPAERRVRLLRGEAHFTIAPNPRRPFIVEASGVAVRAVGTAFNVRRDVGGVEVLVTEGKVRVDDVARGASLLAVPAAPTAPVLAAGQKVVIPVRVDEPTAAVAIATLTSTEIEQTLAWRQRRLEYTEAPLSEIVADFNRYNQHRLVIPDARLASRRFGGTFPAGDYSSFVQLLESTFGVVVERRERETVLRLP